MFQNHEPLWQAPVAGLVAGALWFLWSSLKPKRKSNA